MRRGCIAVGLIKCDACKNIVEQGDRYLLIDDEKPGEKKYICVNCCLKKKYAKQIVEKGEKILTFLID
jgi:hypothetical protein